jgi:hypothetical protein
MFGDLGLNMYQGFDLPLHIGQCFLLFNDHSAHFALLLNHFDQALAQRGNTRKTIQYVGNDAHKAAEFRRASSSAMKAA